MNVEVCAAEIDVDAFRHNLDRVRELAPRARIMAVVKANAYGHDLELLLPALNDVDAIAVARVAEGLAARAAGCDGTIVVLEGVLTAEELRVAAGAGLQLVVHDASQLALLDAHRGQPVVTWLKCDTGMNRLGFRPDDFESAWERLRQCPAVQQPLRLMTHMACADEPGGAMTREQLRRFEDVTAAVDAERSVANSAGILAWPASHGDWVRPGLMLYGISPFADRSARELALRPVMRLRTQLIAVKRVDAGEAVGYGATWRAPRATWIGTAAVGYGDGYPGNLPAGTPVLVGARRVPLAGRVSMDMITVDLGGDGGEVGAEVVVWGGELPVEEIAALAGRIPYELVCGVSPRVPRLAI